MMFLFHLVISRFQPFIWDFFYCKLQKKEALKSLKSSDLELLSPYTQHKKPRHHQDDMFSFLGLGITKSQPKPAFKLLLLGLGC